MAKWANAPHFQKGWKSGDSLEIAWVLVQAESA